MDTRNALQRQYVGDPLDLREPANRAEKRKAQADFKRRCKRREAQRRKKRRNEMIGTCLLALIMGGVFFAAFMIGGDDEPYYAAETTEPMRQVIGSDYMIPTKDYDQYLAERQAYIDAEEAEVAYWREKMEAYQANYEEQQRIAWEEAIANGSLYGGDLVSLTDAESLVKSHDWDANDAELLCRIAMAEAEGEGVKGKALVMMVVLNRAWSDGFPDSIEDVIYQQNQFTPVWTGRFDAVEPDEGCREALKMIEEGWDESQGATYFENTYGQTDTWHSRNLQTLFTYGNHTFYKEWED